MRYNTNLVQFITYFFFPYGFIISRNIIILMNHRHHEVADSSDSQFEQLLSPFTLVFKDPNLETKYRDYTFHKKKTPRWFKWMVWLFIGLLILRRALNLCYALLRINTKIVDIEVEVFLISVFGISYLAEAIIMYCKELIFFRGLPLLVASFFVINYTSRAYYHKECYPLMYFGLSAKNLQGFAFVCVLCLHLHMVFALLDDGGNSLCIRNSLQFNSTIQSIRIPLYFADTINFPIDEKVICIAICCWAYIAFALAAYFLEYGVRHCFYDKVLIAQEKEQWHDLLNNLPLGIVIVKDGSMCFCNHECGNVFGGPPPETASFSAIKEVNGETSIKDVIEDVSKLPQVVHKQYVLDSGSTKYYFTIQYSKITFLSQEATAIILQDQTSFEDLKKLDEKYQRTYMASVVHDIRTPLNGIMGMLDVVQAYPLSEEVKSCIKVAYSSAKLLLYFTFDITDYSQIQAGKFSISLQPFSPLEAVEECMQILGIGFQRKGIRLEKIMASGVPSRIVSDKIRYTQIILNLLGNALKFTQRGEVLISINYRPENDTLVTTVKDTGIGIKEEDLSKLFRLYGRIRDNNEINPTGVGLGLAICKNLTEYLGGNITVTSVYGEGTSFAFSISSNLRPTRAASTSEVYFADEGIVDISMQNDSRNFLNIIHENPMRKFAVKKRSQVTQIIGNQQCSAIEAGSAVCTYCRRQ
eukprot:TRINITY_DN321_c0_g1_i1.p1 TRINITY_DN321_c0_g1~~TRINITY_DN321_c0_g1_i1.p1  ORF type:complete len:697 (+),score=43.18 TRINITY_DN321_c0_g1_i1:126-2216(+)